MSATPSMQELTRLLETIRTEARLPYLSDLHAACYHNDVRDAISRIDNARFCPAAWRMTARYIMGETPELAKIQDARGYLLTHL